MFFVHGGAGAASLSTLLKMKKKLKKVILKNTLEKIAEKMEKSALFNCGNGSSRTENGKIENECCVMRKNQFMSLCMIPERKLPYKEIVKQIKRKRFPGKVVPLSKVYQEEPAQTTPQTEEDKEINQSTAGSPSKDNQILRNPQKNKESVITGLENNSDTVGVVQVKPHSIIAYSSSGGPNGKESGRIGPCSVFGANTFVSGSCAVVISGTGESLIKHQLARRIHKLCTKLLFEEISQEMKIFSNKERLFPYMAGIAIKRKNGEVFLVHFQTAASFIFAYSAGGKTKVIIHQQPKGEIFLNIIRLPDDNFQIK
ncbi:L-asparaginase / beta-aspartyl-peptidase [Nematocida parisii]|uniref:Uncharacterized protein n=1 Tax=Nematocida parisii (strain ERTm3) TaxID=935791 RepID=I3EDP2_NEMP3|nr:hypothetical protein NEQG_02462 [Nematocida parisii ERTm3]KAI5143884.1 L-asparaginase / beta-aspartyl-peptidase [Nematocida parisii]